MSDTRDMTIGEIQTHLNQILMDDHPLTLCQRQAVKKAISGMGLLRRLDRGRQLVEESRRPSNGHDAAHSSNSPLDPDVGGQQTGS